MNNQTPFWKQPYMYFTIMVMVPIYYVIWRVVGDEVNQFTPEMKMLVITAVISTGFGGLLGFWVGTSQSSVRKDERPSPPSGVIPDGTPSDPVSTKEVKNEEV